MYILHSPHISPLSLGVWQDRFIEPGVEHDNIFFIDKYWWKENPERIWFPENLKCDFFLKIFFSASKKGLWKNYKKNYNSLPLLTYPIQSRVRHKSGVGFINKMVISCLNSALSGNLKTASTCNYCSFTGFRLVFCLNSFLISRLLNSGVKSIYLSIIV